MVIELQDKRIAIFTDTLAINNNIKYYICDYRKICMHKIFYSSKSGSYCRNWFR